MHSIAIEMEANALNDSTKEQIFLCPAVCPVAKVKRSIAIPVMYAMQATHTAKRWCGGESVAPIAPANIVDNKVVLNTSALVL